MKRVAVSVVAGFLAGLFLQYVLLTPRVLAQSPVAPKGLINPRSPLANQRFVLVDEDRNSVGTLAFDGAGTPVISLLGQFANRLKGHVTRVLCEIRPEYAATPLEAGHSNH
jgi:hypothetical protein